MNNFAELLREFEAVLVEKGFPANLAMAPGLSRAQIQQVEDDAGIVFPEELVTLYLWKNGPDGIHRNYAFGMEVFDGVNLVSLDHGAFNYKRGQCKEAVSIALELEPYFLEQGGDWKGLRPNPDKSRFWEIAIDGMGDIRYADLAATAGDPRQCLIYGLFDQPYFNSDIPVPLLYRSIQDMIQTTLRCYQEGAFKVVMGENENPSVEKDELHVGRIHCEMNSGLPFWEDYTRSQEP